MDLEILTTFQSDARKEVQQGILPFWIKKVVKPDQSGYFGEVTADLRQNPNSAIGGVLIARILWTFSHAWLQFGNAEYQQHAKTAYEYLIKAFWDEQYGGTFWSVNPDGSPLDSRKLIYGQSFALYGLVEYFRASADKEALETASQLFELIQAHAHDDLRGGYFEAFTRDWTAIPAAKAKEIAEGSQKSMNTHLHLMESFANYLRVDKRKAVSVSVRECLNLFLERIINPHTNHYWLFFDDDWNPAGNTVSFGHDIEGTWLMLEAAEILGDDELLSRVKGFSMAMAESVLNEGLGEDGGLYNEINRDQLIAGDRDWWPQAEAVVGFFNAWQTTGKQKYFDASRKVWSWIKTYMSDPRSGEWHSRIDPHGKPVNAAIADFWKCPYHNSRTCFEIDARVQGVIEKDLP